MSQGQESIAGPAPRQGVHAGSILRAVAYPILLIAGALLLFIANALVWVDTAVVNSGNFSGTVSDVLAEPKVQQRLSEVLAAQAVQNTDIEDRLAAELPDRVAFLSPVVKSQFENVLAGAAQKFLATDLAGNVLDTVVLRLHQRLIAILENDKTALQVQGNQLVLDLPEVLTKLFDRLGVTPPAAIANTTNKDEGPGTVVLIKNTNGLKQASFLVTHRHAFEALALGGALLAFVGTVMVAPTRHRGAGLVGYATIAVGVLTLALILVANKLLESAASERIVVQELFKGFQTSLKWQSILIAAIGVVIVIVADERGRRTISGFGAKGAAQIERVGLGRVLLVALAVAAILLFVL